MYEVKQESIQHDSSPFYYTTFQYLDQEYRIKHQQAWLSPQGRKVTCNILVRVGTHPNCLDNSSVSPTYSEQFKRLYQGSQSSVDQVQRDHYSFLVFTWGTVSIPLNQFYVKNISSFVLIYPNQILLFNRVYCFSGIHTTKVRTN